MKKDKKDKFLDAMGDTDEINVAEYQSARKKKTLIIAVTAALCLLAAACAALALAHNGR